MIRTKVDPLWFKRCCAFHLQFFPDREALSKLSDLQESIERNSTTPLLRVPATSLHMTVATLLNAATQLRIPNHEFWNRKGERWKAIVEKLVEETAPIELHFDEVAASEAAELRELRSAISDAICFEHWRPTPPQIAHMTLFRFSAVEWLPAVDFDAGFLPVGVRVGSLQLLEERVCPNVDVNMLSEPLLLGRSPR
ncbi:2'-5' RNA ligase family protein [Rhizobium leguminosarum]|uniref:2'-5' RNA ligase family protein n=1 Tax=Rhizobium leguminosarum TaxID=384 RepID=UPI001C978C6B|nr:2'-5' RNA ligase family protein [Rhizobium leguminosarum]MBY5770142.1 2'-5' RNA ligase family protein [Rhizobium leguminosarum]